ncbi:MAG: hypothetical protein ACQER9_01580 [Nanobdellota archaeon]
MEKKKIIPATEEIIGLLGQHYPKNISVAFNTALQLFHKKNREELIYLVRKIEFNIKDQKKLLDDLKIIQNNLIDNYRMKKLDNNNSVNDSLKNLHKFTIFLGNFIGYSDDFIQKLKIYQNKINSENIDKKILEEGIDICNEQIKQGEVIKKNIDNLKKQI